MKFEHFWYGLTDGDGYVFKRSPKVLSILKEKSLEFLQKLPPSNIPKYTWLPTEQTVAISIIETAKDKDGRTGRQNHTLLIPIKQYIALTSIKSNFSFPLSDSNVLEPLEVKT
jgi:hypothetical protein